MVEKNDRKQENVFFYLDLYRTGGTKMLILT